MSRTKLALLQAAIDLQLAGDGSALRHMSRELLEETRQMEELIENMLPCMDPKERISYRAHLRRITQG